MDQTSDQYLEFKQALQDVMAETVGEIKPVLAEEFEWKTYVQRHPGTCLCPKMIMTGLAKVEMSS